MCIRDRLRTDVLDMKDLKEGMILKGTVRNVIDFGAFVDIGVHQDGLVHISEMTEKMCIRDRYKANCLTVGNPHCIIFMDQVTPELAKELGPYVENADEFPEKMNLQICRKIDTGNLDIEIWERGSGYTKASGTGSCAAAVAAYRLGLVENRVNVNQPGGMIQIDIKDDDTIYMTGTVGYVADMSVAESFFS